VLKDVETMRTNAASRWVKDDHSRTLSRFHNTDDNSSKTSALSQPKLEILRANSPTLKRLLAARIKLDRYSNSIPRTICTSRPSTRSTPYPRSHEKQSSTVSQPVHVPPPPAPAPPAPPPPPPPPKKQIKPQSNLSEKPSDKITYEKTWCLNGNIKQRCSLEIWLPKPSLDDDDDDDDDDKNSNRTVTPEINLIEKKSQSIPPIKSRRSSVFKITATSTITNIETKSLDEVISKKSESVMPRVYQYTDYIIDLPDERPRSSKSVTTVKSDSGGSIKSIRRQHTRSHNRRQSVSTHHSEEILRFGTIEVPTSAKTLSVNNPNRETKSNNPSMINELMQKYSLIKKTHQELIQTKLQLEKPNNDSKNHPNLIKDQSPRVRPPSVPESTSLISAVHPTVSVKKLFLDTTPVRPMTEHNHNTNTKLLERRSTPGKSSQSDVYPHLRIFSLANQRQHRQSSASIPPALLPTVSGKKTDETSRILQRSKTLDVVLNIPNPINIKSNIPIQPDNLLQHTTNGTDEQISSYVSKRSSLSLRSEKQNNESITQNSRHYYHHSSTITTMPTNTLLNHFNHGNSERKYLVPE